MMRPNPPISALHLFAGESEEEKKARKELGLLGSEDARGLNGDDDDDEEDEGMEVEIFSTGKTSSSRQPVTQVTQQMMSSTSAVTSTPSMMTETAPSSFIETRQKDTETTVIRQGSTSVNPAVETGPSEITKELLNPLPSAAQAEQPISADLNGVRNSFMETRNGAATSTARITTERTVEEEVVLLKGQGEEDEEIPELDSGSDEDDEEGDEEMDE